MAIKLSDTFTFYVDLLSKQEIIIVVAHCKMVEKNMVMYEFALMYF